MDCFEAAGQAEESTARLQNIQKSYHPGVATFSQGEDHHAGCLGCVYFSSSSTLHMNAIGGCSGRRTGRMDLPVWKPRSYLVRGSARTPGRPHRAEWAGGAWLQTPFTEKFVHPVHSPVWQIVAQCDSETIRQLSVLSATSGNRSPRHPITNSYSTIQRQRHVPCQLCHCEFGIGKNLELLSKTHHGDARIHRLPGTYPGHGNHKGEFAKHFDHKCSAADGQTIHGRCNTQSDAESLPAVRTEAPT